MTIARFIYWDSVIWHDDIHVDGQGNEHTAVGCHYGRYVSMISFIERKRDKIRKALRSMLHLVWTLSCVNYHDPFLQEMEVALCVWLEDNDGDCRDTIEVGVWGYEAEDKAIRYCYFFTNSYVFPSAMHCMSCDYPDNFQLGSPTFFH